MTKADLLFEEAERAMQEAADKVVEEARRAHGVVVVWENGAVRRIPADQLPIADAGVADKPAGK
ncbi:MAG: hypothetical protein WCB27_16660 [Thermoguttaceae bacterium]